MSGEIDQGAGMLSEDTIEKGYTLLCVATPKSDAVIDCISEVCMGDTGFSDNGRSWAHLTPPCCVICRRSCCLCRWANSKQHRSVIRKRFRVNAYPDLHPYGQRQQFTLHLYRP